MSIDCCAAAAAAPQQMRAVSRGQLTEDAEQSRLVLFVSLTLDDYFSAKTVVSNQTSV